MAKTVNRKLHVMRPKLRNRDSISSNKTVKLHECQGCSYTVLINIRAAKNNITCLSMSMSQCVHLYIAHQQTDSPSPRLYALGVLERSYHANKNVFSRRLKAASVEFGLRTGSERLFQANGPAMAKARPAARVESVTWYVHCAQRNGDVSGWTVSCHDYSTKNYKHSKFTIILPDFETENTTFNNGLGCFAAKSCLRALTLAKREAYR